MQCVRLVHAQPFLETFCQGMMMLQPLSPAVMMKFGAPNSPEDSIWPIYGFHFLRQRFRQVDEISDELFDIFAVLVLNGEPQF